MSASGPVRVLIVEDSVDQRELFRTYFEKAGCAVVTAKSAEDAIPVYFADPPELAVIDLLLPGMSGKDLVSKLREDLPTCAIAVTSVLEARHYPRAEAILPKPVTRAQVIQALADCVPRWATQQ